MYFAIDMRLATGTCTKAGSALEKATASRGLLIDLTDPVIQQELESYVPLIQQGHGAEVLLYM